MGTDTDKPMVAIINNSPAIVEGLELALREQGFATVGAETQAFQTGERDIDTFLRRFRPSAVVFDIAAPYAANWRFFASIEDRLREQGRHIVLTTTNTQALAKIAGMSRAFEVVGKPFDLDRIVQAVCKGLDAAKPCDGETA